MFIYEEISNIEKATASAADLWDPRLGCSDAWMIVFVLAWWQIWQQFGMHFGCLASPVVSLGMVLGWSLQACGSIWTRLGQPGCPNELFGIPVQAGAPI